MDIRKFIDKVKNFNSPSSTYEQLGARNLMEGIKLNGFSINRDYDPEAETIYFISDSGEITEAIVEEFEKKGGIIVFSVNVNAVEMSKNKMVNFLKGKIETLKNNLFKNKKINKIIKQTPEVYGITIGNFVKGRYKANDGKLYDESSMSIEIIGISTETLLKVAEDIAEEFKQETVLVKDYQENRIYLVK